MLYDGLRGKRASPQGGARRWSPARDPCPPWGSPCPGRSARTRRAALPRLTGFPVGHTGSTPEAFSRLEGENFTKYSKRKSVFVGRPGLQKPLSGNVRRGPATVPLRPRPLEQLPGSMTSVPRAGRSVCRAPGCRELPCAAGRRGERQGRRAHARIAHERSL